MTSVVLDNANTVVRSIDGTDFVVSGNESNTVKVVQESVFVSLEKRETLVVQSDSATVLVAGSQGPPGPPGLAEEDIVYSKRIDFINDNLLYKGEAAVGSSESNPVWRIRKIVVGADGDVTEVWAGGTADFTNSWINRASYIYS